MLDRGIQRKELDFPRKLSGEMTIIGTEFAMNRSYLGTLDYSDPLYEILLSQVFPDVKDPVLHVNRISSRAKKYIPK